MRDWIPIPGTTKERLVRGALAEFGARGYAAVSVNELAELANVTIGSLYHHFGSKIGIYGTVREDVERRVLDRMEGAAAMRQEGQPAPVGAILLVGYDYLVRSGYARLLAEPHPERESDPIEAFVSGQADRDGAPYARLLLALWREALSAAAEPEAAPSVRAALSTLLPH